MKGGFFIYYFKDLQSNSTHSAGLKEGNFDFSKRNS